MNWLKNIRKTEKLTQIEVAEKVGVTRAYYTNIENGERRPSVDVAKRIGQALDLDWTRFYEADPDEEAEEERQES